MYYLFAGAFTPPINYYRNIDFADRTTKIPKVKVPSLIVWGTEDMALDRRLADMYVIKHAIFSCLCARECVGVQGVT